MFIHKSNGPISPKIMFVFIGPNFQNISSNGTEISHVYDVKKIAKLMNVNEILLNVNKA